MPTLEWIGKEKVVNHHHDVPYRILERRYSFDEKGEHEADNGSENMIIHGDNLEALKALLPRYEGKVDCIYIDPPYNTGNEGWIYNDNVNDPKIRKWLGEVVGKEGEDFTRHDKWLCMMYPRLRLIKKLLSNNGNLIISIGYHELHNLMHICKEIYSTFNINAITVQTSGGKPNSGFNFTHEHLVFITSKNFSPNSVWEDKTSYASPYHGMNLATFNQEQRPNQTYPIYIETTSGRIVGVGPSLQELINTGIYKGEKKDFKYNYDNVPDGCIAIWPITAKGTPCVWRLIPSRLLDDWEKGYIKVVKTNKKNSITQYTIQYLSEGIINKIKSGELITYKISDNPLIPTVDVINYMTEGANIPTIWTDKRLYTSKGGDEISAIFGVKNTFQYPKPVELIYQIINRVSFSNSLILDSFAGSGTTAHAVLKANQADGGKRRFILVEMGEYAESITAERVKRVIRGYGEGKKAVAGTGGSFSYYELGAELMTREGQLNEAVGEERIREYIWHTETRAETPTRRNGNRYYLGTHLRTAYYFYYSPEQVTTLNHAFLATIPEREETTVIYADKCAIGEHELMKLGIIFKKIPRDITKL